MSKKKIGHSNDSGFKTPEGYFDSLETKILNKIGESSFLETKTNAGFKVPDNYFKDFKVETKNTPTIAWRKVVYLSGVAATIALLLTVFIPREEPTFESLETAAIENYLLNETFESSEIAGLLTDDDLTMETFDLTIDSEEMENFILENTSVENLIDL